MLYLQTIISIIDMSFILGCFLLGFTLFYLIFMSNNTNFNIKYVHGVTHETYNPREKLGPRLLAQLLHNNANPGMTRNYQNFPFNHEGYLDSQKKIRLVSIIRSSSISDQYRYGSSVGNFYVKNTNNFPDVTPEMIGIVLAAETLS